MLSEPSQVQHELDMVDRINTIARRSLLLAGAAALGAVVGFSAGCSNLKMPVPPELVALSEEVPITGRSKLAGLPGVDESFQIGPYAITGVDRDVTFTGRISIFGLSHKQVRGGYSYLFRGSNDERKAECVIEGDEKAFAPGGSMSLSLARGALKCVCYCGERTASLMMPLSYSALVEVGGEGENKWRLGGAGEECHGELSIGARDFRVKVISGTEQKGFHYVAGEGWGGTTVVPTPEPTGCLVDGDGPAGGLELVHPGRAWFARSLNATEREDMACLFGGLLLYKSPSGGPRR